MATKWQAEAKRLIDKAERDGSATVKTSRKKPTKKTWRARAYTKMARKHPVAAIPVWTVIALATLVGKSAKWSGIGAGRGSRSAGKVISRHLGARVNADLHKRKWTPQAEPVDGRWPKEHYRCCGHSYTSTQTLNAHQLTHRSEGRRGTRPPAATIQIATTASHAGKVLVLDAAKSGGRHRASHQLPRARNVNDLVTHYREHLNRIGVGIMAVNSTTRRLKQAATAFGTDTPCPGPLADLRAICVGMEVAMGALSEAIDEFATMLKKPGDAGGANIAAELVNPYLTRAREYADATGREFTRFIAGFEVYYADAIRAAAHGAPLPAMDLSKTG